MTTVHRRYFTSATDAGSARPVVFKHSASSSDVLECSMRKSSLNTTAAASGGGGGIMTAVTYVDTGRRNALTTGQFREEAASQPPVEVHGAKLVTSQFKYVLTLSKKVH